MDADNRPAIDYVMAKKQLKNFKQLAERQVDIAAHHDRRNVMLVGESTMLGLSLPRSAG